MPLGLTALVSATDADIQKKIYGPSMITLLTSNKELKDMKLNKSLKEPGFFIKGVSKINENETKQQKKGFFGMLVDTLAASLLENILGEKGVVVYDWSWPGILMLPHPFNIFKIEKYYQNKPRINGVYTINNLLR